MGKSIYHLYGCVEEAFPEDETVFYKGLFQHIASMEQNPSDETSFANVLKAVGAKHSLRKRLLGYVSFLSSAGPYLSPYLSIFAHR